MDANSWLWVAFIAFLVFCCYLPMRLMGRHKSNATHSGSGERGAPQQRSDRADR